MQLRSLCCRAAVAHLLKYKMKSIGELQEMNASIALFLSQPQALLPTSGERLLHICKAALCNVMCTSNIDITSESHVSQ